MHVTHANKRKPHPPSRLLDGFSEEVRARVEALARLGHPQQRIATMVGIKKYDVQRIAAAAGIGWKRGAP